MAAITCLVVALLMSTVLVGAAPRANDMFTYSIVNTVRDPKFSFAEQITIEPNKTLIRYMEDLTLKFPQKFTSFEAKYTSPYGDYVESVNGVKESYTVDGYYWEFFVNTIGVSIGVSFYVPKPNDIVLLEFTKDAGTGSRSAQRLFIDQHY